MQILLKLLVNKDFLSGLENERECYSAFIDRDDILFTCCTNLVALRQKQHSPFEDLSEKSVCNLVAQCQEFLPQSPAAAAAATSAMIR